MSRDCRFLDSVPCLWPQQRHPPRPYPRIENRPRHQPCGPWPPATAARATHPSQHITDRRANAVEACQIRHREGPFATTAGRQAVNDKAEAGKLRQRAGEYGGPLSTGGGVGGGHEKNIERTSGSCLAVATARLPRIFSWIKSLRCFKGPSSCRNVLAAGNQGSTT